MVGFGDFGEFTWKTDKLACVKYGPMALTYEDIIVAVWWNDAETYESGQTNKQISNI